jgi:1,4-dihydroxy-2-naphthoate octaprenyltransferase
MKIKYWIKAARLRTLPLALSSILMGAALAFINSFHVSFQSILLAILTTLLLQILSNFANDYGDGIKGSDKNRSNGDRMVQSGKISSRQMLITIIITSFLTFTVGSILLFKVFGIQKLIYLSVFMTIGVLAIIAAIKYTVGKNAYGYNGFGDVFVFIFFGVVGVVGSYFLFAKSFSIITVSGAFFTGLLSCGVLNMNNMRDYENDKTSNKNTLVVVIGLKYARIYQYLSIIGAFLSLLTVIVYSNNNYLWGSILPFLILFKHLIYISNNDNLNNLDGQLKLIAISCFSCCIILFITSYIT